MITDYYPKKRYKLMCEYDVETKYSVYLQINLNFFGKMDYTFSKSK